MFTRSAIRNAMASITPVSLTVAYFNSVAFLLGSIPAPATPVSFIDYMRYIEQIQNATRPQVEAAVGVGDTAFVRNYADNNSSYATTVLFVLESWQRKNETLQREASTPPHNRC